MENKKFMNVDVIAILEEKMKCNTVYYQSDFEIDKKALWFAAESERKENKSLLWLSRESGTHLLKEHDAFIKDSAANTTWCYFAEHDQDSKPIVACAVEVACVKDGVILGNVYELDYLAHVAEVAEKSVAALEHEKIFEDGYVERVPFERSSYGYYLDLVEKHGPIVDSYVVPRDEFEHAAVLQEQKAKRSKFKSVEYLKNKRKPSLDSKIEQAALQSASQNNLEKKSKENCVLR